MGACGGGHGALGPEFAARVELELAVSELRERLVVAPSPEVFVEEHRRRSLAAGRRLRYGEVVVQLVGPRGA
jgi:hypothetical protein